MTIKDPMDEQIQDLCLLVNENLEPDAGSVLMLAIDLCVMPLGTVILPRWEILKFAGITRDEQLELIERLVADDDADYLHGTAHLVKISDVEYRIDRSLLPDYSLIN